ncbi:MAG TPA: bifunctional diaminohydroxyphosphoribosylaminopyrimidine deaminase/5-amino-6-(5-phosphoribosylamino)uracil reductase RibD [Candidatus Polarisedimenticolia bacterium]|nr:bifunctional diaminohydroxyphosphoribosylaminopyrimidine deaminase/5-amino-6-(5-phosphoribosylamino)uracil reductase RibD [Candidatus Polarisedimenticolia bacterium]
MSEGDEAIHRHYLAACLELARHGEGRTSPNPMVGAMVVKEGRILSQGFHRRAGDPHAEIEALAAAGEAARGAVLYVNLEPCVHHGLTPPCVEAVIRSGVHRVVACMLDPDPRVNGRGFERLRGAGVEILYGLLRDEAARLNEKFVKFVTTGRPFVTLKAGMTLDGRIATAAGESRWITSPEARTEAHRLRAAHDAILVGVGTILADDPRLTARAWPGKSLVRVILDSRLRTPTGARALSGEDGGKTLIYTGTGKGPQHHVLEKRAGVEVVEVAGAETGLDLEAVFTDLGKRRILSVLVEGGGGVLGSVLRSRSADAVALFIAPKILGGGSKGVFDGFAAAGLSDAESIHEWSWRPVGEDLLVEGRLGSPDTARAAACSLD